MDKYHPGFFGKVGMRTFHLTVNRSWSPAVNVDHLWSLLPKNTLQEASKKKGVAPVIDVTKKGYAKVLGKGALPKQPLIVKAKFFSRTAELKIKNAGGACILTA